VEISVVSDVSVVSCDSVPLSESQETTETSETTEISTTTISGVVVDGYLRNAKVCLDINDNKKCDLGEPTAPTGEGGRYTLNVPADLVSKYPVIAEVIAGQTVDEDTNQPVDKDVILQAPPGKPDVVSPLTTLVATEIEKNPALTLEQAELKVKEQMGVSSDVSLLEDYVQKENENEEYKKLHEVAKIVTEVVGEILDDVEDQVSEEERDALLVAITDAVKEELPNIVQTVEETLDNEISTDNATLDTDESLDVDTIVSQVVSQVNATEVVEDVKDIDNQLEVVETAEVSSNVLSLIGKRLYTIYGDNGQIYVSGGIISYDSEKDYRLSIDNLSSVEDVFTKGDLDGNASVTVEDEKIVIHDSDSDIRIDSVAVVDLAGKTLKASQVFEGGMYDLEEIGLQDFDITFSSGKEYILSLIGLKQDPSQVAQEELTLNNGDCHELPSGITNVEDFVNYYSVGSSNIWYEDVPTQFGLDGKLYKSQSNEFFIDLIGTYGKYWFETVTIDNQTEKLLVLDKGIYNNDWYGELLRIVQDENGTYYYCVADYRFADSVMTWGVFDEDAMTEIVNTLRDKIGISTSTTGTTETIDTTTTTIEEDDSYSIPSNAVDTTYDELVGKTLYLIDFDDNIFTISTATFSTTSLIVSENVPVLEVSSLDGLPTESTCTVSFVDGTYEIQCPDDVAPVKVTSVKKLDLSQNPIEEKGLELSTGTIYYLIITKSDGSTETISLLDETAMNQALPQLQEEQNEINAQLAELSSTISGTVTFEDPSVWSSNLKIRITPDVEQIDGDWGGVVCTINQDGTFGDDCVLYGDIENYTADHTYQVEIFEDVDGDYRYEPYETNIWFTDNASLDEVKNNIFIPFTEWWYWSTPTLPYLDATLYRGTAISSPNDDTCWFNDQNATITWDTTQIQGNTVDIYILYDSPFDISDISPDTSIIMSKFWSYVTTTQNTGSLTVDPAIFGGTGNAYKILIISDIGYWDMSDGTFNLNIDCSIQ